jgi:isopenicillin-N epimerase
MNPDAGASGAAGTTASAMSGAGQFGRAMLKEWMLDPAVTYLNHGTVGAVPRRVLAAQQAIRDEIEREPARFLLRELADVKEIAMRARPRMRVAADTVAQFLGVLGEDLVFADNTTAGVNAIVRSFDFGPDDEIVLTDHGYGALKNTANYVASRTGAAVRIVHLPGPPYDPAAIIDTLTRTFTRHTRMLIVDHITSGSALVLPVAAIAAAARAAGVAVLIDGAHAPGALHLDLPALGGDWYVGNLHKWAMSPRSAAILWASPARHKELHPTVISWGYGHGIDAEFDLTGTRDPSPWLAAPAGIEFMRALPIEAMRAYNHAFVWNAARELTDRWGTAMPAPESMIGCMVTIPLPARMGTSAADATRLKDALLYEERIEVQIHAWKGGVWMRICGQVYNDASDIERLSAALEKHSRG